MNFRYLGIKNSKIKEQGAKSTNIERLIEDISRLIFSKNILNINISFLNVISDKMKSDINVLRPSMQHMIIEYGYNTCFVTADRNGIEIISIINKLLLHP